MRSMFSMEELEEENVKFEVEPELPEGVTMNRFTGELSGTFVWQREEYDV